MHISNSRFSQRIDVDEGKHWTDELASSLNDLLPRPLGVEWNFTHSRADEKRGTTAFYPFGHQSSSELPWITCICQNIGHPMCGYQTDISISWTQCCALILIPPSWEQSSSPQLARGYQTCFFGRGPRHSTLRAISLSQKSWWTIDPDYYFSLGYSTMCR